MDRGVFMHAPSAYEWYIAEEMRRYGMFPNYDNEIPSWLIHEQSMYRWIFRLSRKMWCTLQGRSVSKDFLERLKNINTIRFRKYQDVSPALKEAIEMIVVELSSLYEDLKSPEMWKRPHLLSQEGIRRWRRAANVVSEGLYVMPDPQWREEWEKEMFAPYCTRKEAENIVVT